MTKSEAFDKIVSLIEERSKVFKLLIEATDASQMLLKEYGDLTSQIRDLQYFYIHAKISVTSNDMNAILTSVVDQMKKGDTL